MKTFFMWICPTCGMKNYETIEMDKYICRAGDCGEEFDEVEIIENDEEKIMTFDGWCYSK